MPAAQLEAVLREPEIEILRAEPAGSGIMGALRIAARFPAAGRTLELKWKPAPRGGDGWNNTPRREVAAYEVQKWFLSPDAYIVPTTVARCIALADYAAIDPDAKPNLAEGECVFGALVVWLDGVEPPELLLDEARFYSDAPYARSVAEYNLLTYLIRNRDSRIGNQLASSDPSVPRFYSIDNGITFRSEPYNFFQPQWDRIRVPALPADAIGRLRAVDADDLEALKVIAEFHLDRDGGSLREVPVSAPFEAEHGIRLRDGVLQLGLEPGEIEALAERLRALLAAVDRGEISVF